METFIRTYPHLCDLTLVNILAELYLSNGRFEDTVQLVVRGLRPAQPGGALRWTAVGTRRRRVTDLTVPQLR